MFGFDNLPSLTELKKQNPFSRFSATSVDTVDHNAQSALQHHGLGPLRVLSWNIAKNNSSEALLSFALYI